MIEKMITREELQELLGLTAFQIKQLEREGMPVFTFSQKAVRYDPAAVNEWLREHKLQEGKKRA